MLGGSGGGVNSGLLSLDLQFAADKTLTARRGPTPTFTRASAATEVGPDGLIRYAPENLALQSENFGTTWVNNTGNALALNDALSPTGTLTADRIDFPATATTGLTKLIQQSFSGTYAGSGPVTASVWLRTVSGTSTVYLTLLDGSPWQRVHVACNVTTEWTRFSVTLNTPAISLFLAIGPDTRTTHGTPAQPAVQDAASVYAWGAQLERHTSARAYIPTTTAAVFNARFDHDPVTLACKGLLIEEARTNLALQSEDFGTTWVSVGASVSVNAATSPNGLVTADKIILDLSSVTGRVQQATTLSGSHTFSAFLKASEWNWAFITPSMAVGGVWFNLSNGTIGTQQAGCVGSIVSYGNGWYRCSVTVTGTGSISSTRVTPTNADNTITAGDGTSGIFAWGAQLEAGSFPTSYIPTVASSVVRSADVCSITGSAFSNLWNTSGGTLFFEGVLPSAPTVNNRYLLSSGGTRRWVYGNNAGIGGVTETIAAFDGSLVEVYFSNVRLTTKFKIAISVGALTLNASFNGLSVVTKSHNGNLLNSVTLLGILESSSGFVTSVRYYKKNLSNAKLQTLTT
jgi:hypothetical protein